MYFDFNLTTNSDALSKVVDELKTKIRSAGHLKLWRKDHTKHLTLIVLNLLHTYRSHPQAYVSYSRMNGVYARIKKAGSRYVPFPISYASTTKLIDALQDPCVGMVEHDKGFYFPKQGNCKPSRMRTTQKLIDLVEQHQAADETIERDPNTETILLKDTDKNLMGYVDDTNTIRMRNNLKRINAMLDKHFIGLCVVDQIRTKINQRLLDLNDKDIHDEIPDTLDPNRHHMYRVFNNGSFEQGGRFYGAWWQSLPKEYRRYIRIDNVGTEELDFPGLHINLLYAIEGIPLPKEDPYIVDGLPREARPFLKVALNVLINATDQEKGLRAVRHKFPRKKLPPELKNFDYRKIVELFMDKHPPLAKHFGSGFGVRLQYLDSQIAEETLLTLADNGIPALPMHDSFIVSRKHAQNLNKAMNDAIHNRFNVKLDLKASPTAYEGIYEIGYHEEHGSIGLQEEIGGIEEYEGTEWTRQGECGHYYRDWQEWKKRMARRQ